MSTEREATRELGPDCWCGCGQEVRCPSYAYQGYLQGHRRDMLRRQRAQLKQILAKETVARGNTCEVCGSGRKLLWHHEFDKLFQISDIVTNRQVDFTILEEELSKCKLICYSCHGHLHNGRELQGVLH